MTPHAHMRSLPPGPVRGRFAAQGGLASLEAAPREAVTSHAHLRSLPPGPARGRFAALGGLASLDLVAALREAV